MRVNKKVFLLFIIALAAFMAPFLYTSYPLSDDAWQHIQKAECYIANGGFPVKALYSADFEGCISHANYPPLFDLLLGFGKYFGMGFFSRFLPSLIAALTVFAFYPLARRFLDEDDALIATALAVFTPEFMILGSANAQPQVLGILLSILCLNSLLDAIDSKEGYWKNVILSAVYSTLIIYSYTTYVFFVYGIILLFIIADRRLKAVKDIVIVSVIAVILSLPMLMKMMMFPLPNAWTGGLFFHDSYWFLLPIRIGMPALVFAFFAGSGRKDLKFVYSALALLSIVSIFRLTAPFPPMRNLAFLVFPLAIIGVSGWHSMISRKGLSRHYRALSMLLVIVSLAAGLIAVHYFVKLETVTDEEYHAAQWMDGRLDAEPGRIATFNFGPFNYAPDMQYNGDIFDGLEEKLISERIRYVILTSKTPEGYKMGNSDAARLLEEHCGMLFNEKEIYIFDCMPNQQSCT